MDEEPRYLSFACPHCDGKLDFTEGYAGRAQPCPECGEPIVVPSDGSATGWLLPLPLETTRLVVRRLEPADETTALEILGDPDLELPWPVEDENRALAVFHEEQTAQLTDARGMLTLAIVRRDTDEVAGLGSVRYVDPERFQGTLFLTIGRAHQRQGLGTEAFVALLWFCFRGVGLHRVAVTCDPQREPMVRFLRKAGMRQEGLLLKDRPAPDGWADTLQFALLESEFTPGAGSEPRVVAADAE